MIEYDLVMMSLLVFMPSLFALLLLCFPRKAEKAMLWWSLLGTAVTVGLSIAIFINWKVRTVDVAVPFSNAAKRALTTLDYRAGQANAAIDSTALAEDWVGRAKWVPQFSIEYYLGLDGISMPLVLMTTVLCFLSMIASFGIKRYDSTERFVRGYCMLFLILETGMLGTFLALDFFLFYIFWEVMLLPMYFLIGIWGGPRREYAAIKFFLYTLLGSVFILIALLAFYFTDMKDFVAPGTKADAIARLQNEKPGLTKEQATEKVRINTFDLLVMARAGKAALEYIGNGRDITRVSTPALAELRKAGDAAKTKAGEEAIKKRFDAQWFFQPWFQIVMFLFLFIGFAIKVPVFPFHTWLPDAHVEAPTPISMILAGVLLKLGGYGILRIAYPICPWAAEYLAAYVALFGVINIVYGAFAAMAQTDFKKLVAYSSVSHMGYVILGVAVWSSQANAAYWGWGMNGAMYQMIAHGITSAGMFFCVGVIYDRAHHRNLDNFRGLYEPMPMYGGVAAVIFFAAMGLPGMCGFIGEFMVVLSAFSFAPGGQQWVGITFAVLAALTVVLTAAYILWTIQRVFMGTNPSYKNYKDITLQELACAVPIIVFAVLLGVLPNLLLYWMEPSVTSLVDTLASFRP